MTATARNGVAPLRRLAQACVLLALVGLASAPAQAQVEDYISNLRSTLGSSTAGANEITTSRRFSQEFRTGSRSGGYPLSEVVLHLSDIGTGAIEVTIRENSVSGSRNVPGTTRYTLTNPSSLSEDGQYTFTAPSNAMLEADTTYHIVAESTSGSAARWRRISSRSSATIDNAGGWDIDFDYLRKSGAAAWSPPRSDAALAAAVRGELPAPPPPPEDILVSNTGKDGESRRDNQFFKAQSFTTGDAPGGYDLSSVVLEIANPRGRIQVAIRESDADGDPGDIVYDLGRSPSDEGGGLWEWQAPAGAMLEPGTDYHVWARDFSSPGQFRWWKTTAEDGTDPGAASGWSIGGRRTSVSGTSWIDQDRSYQFQIRGTETEVLPVVTIERVSPLEVTEGTDLEFRVTREGGDTSQSLTVNYFVTETGGDMVASGDQGEKTLVLPPGDTEKTVTVPTVDDSLDEQHSTVTVNLQPSASYELGDDTTFVRVNDNDEPNTPATGELTIDDTAPRVGDTLTADASQISDADGPASPTFTWQWIRVASDNTETPIPGATSASYTVVAADLGATLKVEASFTDDGGTDEAVESAPTAAVGEALPTVTVTPVTTPVTEGSDAVFRLARTGDTAARLQLFFSISETGDMCRGTNACNGATTSASIPAGQASTNLFVGTSDDSAHEADSVVTVTLAANAAYELGTDRSAEVTVEDNDNAPPTGTVTIDDTTPMVGETLTADASGVSDPDGPASLTITWRWLRVSGGTATPIPGATSETYTVVAADAGATLKAEAAFTDDDGTAETVESAETDPVPPVLSIGDASAAEGDSGSATLEFTVTLDPAATETVTVDWATSDDTATAGTDYTTGSGTLTFDAGDSSRTVSVTVAGDEVDEPDETFEVTLTNPSGATLGDATATGTITNDDDDPTVTLVLTPDTITEDGGASALSATLDHASGRDTVVTVSVSPVGPATASDYSLSPNVETLELLIPAGDTASDSTVTITAVDNNVDAPHKTVTVSATAANEAGVTAPQDVTLTITDDENAAPTGAVTIDDTTPMVGETLTADASGVSDPDGPASLTFTWRWLRVSGGTDTPIPGATSKTYTVVDADVGSTLKVEAAFTDDGGTSETVESAATGTVEAASLPTVTLVVTPASISENGGTSTVTARLNRATDAHVWLTVSVEPVSPAVASDYTLSDNKRLVIQRGSTTSTGLVTITAVNNDTDAPNKSVTVKGPADPNTFVVNPAPVTLTIEDDDEAPLPTVSVAPVASPVVESEDAQFTVTRTGVTTGALTVRYNVVETGAMVRSGDKGAQTVSFSGNTASVTVTVPTVFDNLHEPNSRVTVTLTADAAYELGTDATARVLVKDDDDSPATGTVTVTGTAREGETLTADTSGIADEDGGLDTAAYVYQWVRTPSGGGDEDISGATSETYVPVSADAGATLKVRVTVTDDEGHEATFTSAPTSAVAALPALSIDDASVDEGDSGSATLDFTVTLDSAATETVTVEWATSDGTATAGTDYTAGDGTVTFNAGDSSKTVSVTVAGDNVDEPNETFTVTLSNPSGATIGDGAATGTITDDDATPTVTLALSSSSITEVNQQSTVTARLDHPSSEETTVTVSVSPVSPAVAGDYRLSTNRVLTIAAGATTSTGTVTVTSVNNTVDAPDKTVTVSGTATNSQGVTAPDSVTLTIRDNDATPTVTLVLIPASIPEAGGTSTVTATLNHPSSDATTVTVSASPVSPAVAGDYTLSGNLDLTIAAGATTSTGTVTITAVDNDVVAADKEVTVSATATNGQGVTAPDDVPLAITDDDEPGLSIADASVAEGDSGSTTMTFTVTLNPVAVSPVTVAWATADGTARAGTDYTAGNGSLTFNVGDSTKTVTVSVTGDDVDEPNETLTVRLSNASGATIADAEATGTIRDDDDAPTVTLVLTPSSITEVNQQSTVTATLDHPSSEATTVTVSVAPDSPAVAGDYTLSGNLDLTIAAGATTSTGTVTVTSVNNTVDAPDKTVTVSATATNTQGVTDPAPVTLTIRDNDATPKVTLVLTPASITEAGGTSTVTATLNHPSSAETTVTVSVTPVSPAVAGDYTLSANRELTIAAGATTSTGTVTVTGVDNTADTPDKTVTVSGAASNGQGVTGPDDVALTIEDNDGPPTVTLVLSPASITEVNEQSTVTATLDRASGADTTVTVSVSPDSPAVAGDYTLSTNRVLTIAAGQTTSTGTVTVTGVDNTVDAPDKTVTVSGTATNSQGVTAPDDVTLTIRDNDATPTVTLVLSPASITEVNQESTVTATLDHPSSEATTVTVSVAPVSPAVAGDYRLSANRVLMIAAGATTSTGTVTVTSVNNAVDAPDKTVMVSGTATNAQGVTDPANVTLTIRDNDATPAVTLVLTPASITESGGTSTVTATLNHPSSEATTVTVSVSPVSPAVMADYMLSSNRVLTIAAGSTTSTGTVTITAVDNDVVAAAKEVTVSATATNGQGVTAPDDVSLAITDDDVPGLSVADASVAEGDSGGTTMTFTVTLNPAAVSPVTVDWATADGTATAGTDYTAGNGSLTFNAGDSTKTVSVTVTGDDVDEPDETFTVTLSNVSGATIADAEATGTIRDDDAEPTVTLVLNEDSITEAAGVSTVTATLDRPSSEATTVTVSVAPVSPAVAGDYRLSANRELTIAAGATTSTGTVTVTSVNNTVDAPHKTVTVSGTATNSQGVTAPDAVTLTIRDNDATPAVTLVLTPASITESGGTSTVTATLNHPSSDATTVTVSASPVSPAVAGDYMLSSNRVLTIAAGATTSTGTVTITAVDNDVMAAAKEVTVSATATNAQGITVPDDVTLTIRDDDATPMVTLVLTPASIPETGGTSTVTATLDHPSSEATTVTVSAAPVSPAVAGDYTLSGSQLTIAAGQTDSTGTVTIRAVDNDVDAADREVTVSGTATNSRGVTAPAPVTLTITNDDKATIGLSVSLGTMSLGTGDTPEEVSEGAGETTVTVTATVTGTTPLGEERTVTVSVTSGQDGAVGFAKVEDFPIVVPAGPPGTSASETFVLVPEDDEVAEADAILRVSGSVRDVDGAIVTDAIVTEAMLTLTDNDEAPTDIELSVADVVVREDAGEAVFTLRLSHPSESDVEVAATFTEGTAKRGEDYRPDEERVVFARGETERELRVALVDDEAMERNETFEVTFEVMLESGEGSPERLEASATCTIVDDEVADAREHRLEYALASFGRTVVQDLVTAVEDRRWAPTAGTTATLAGTRLPLSEEAVYEALRRHTDPDGDLVAGTDALRELLSRSSFQLSLGGEGEAGGPGADSLVLWGRGSQSWSAGRLDPEVGTEGEVLSGQLGVEFRPREDTLVGVMLNGSAGEQEFDGALGAEVETEVLGVHPYAQWSPREGLRTWAMVGYGAGEATLTDEYSALAGTDLEMMMAAGGGSHEVASLWGIDWSVGTSGFFVQLDADEVRFDAEGQAALVPAVKSEVWQMRLLLEGSAGEDFGGVEGLRGNVELAARVDGGDAESGMGMEVGGGVGYGRADLGLEVEASGRMLLTHEEEGLEDAGVSLSLELDPGAPGRGVYFALAPSWGNAASGARSVWEGRETTAGESVEGDRFDPRMRLSSELGYTAPTPLRRGTLTTYGAFSSDGGASRQYRVGRRLELGIASMSLEAERHESAGAAPEHGVWLRGNLRF